MKVLHVIPIARGFTKDQLSYFTLKDIPKGALVEVPLRNKIVHALVIDVEDVEDAKSKLRQSSFALKKLASDNYTVLFLPEFIETTKALGSYFSASQGAVLHQLVPKVMLDNASKLPKTKSGSGKINHATVSEKLVFQADEKNRFTDYRGLVREAFARGNSIYIVTPTVRETERLSNLLNKGIENYCITLHGELSPKEQLKRIEKVMKEQHSVVIVATAPFLSIPRADIETIIVERETARSYKLQTRPYIDLRIAARMYAEARDIRFILADLPLSIETMWRARAREYEEFTGNRGRSEGQAHQYIIDMRRDPESTDRSFHLFSEHVLETLDRNVKNKKHSFVFTSRKGLAPITVCEDCGSTVSCTTCGANVVLHKAANTNIFVCHSCGEHRSAKERCKACNSWKLKALGIGVERVVDTLKARYGDKRVFVIDGDHTKTYSQAKKVADQFYKTDGSILVGTGLALSFLEHKIATSIIASIDSMLSLPDPKMYEHIFSLLIRIRNSATDSFYIQTRQPELPLIEYVVSGNTVAFYEKEILERRKFDYPPFSILIKLSSYGSPADASRVLEEAEEKLKKYNFTIFPGYTPTPKGGYILSGLLKIPSDTWPDSKLLGILRSLPPSVAINVSPENTL